MRIKLLAQHCAQVLTPAGGQAAVCPRALEHALHELALALARQALGCTTARAISHACEPLRFIALDPVVDLADAHERGLCSLLNTVTQRQVAQGQQAAADAGVALSASAGFEHLGIPLLGDGSGAAFLHRAPVSWLVAQVSQNFV